MQRSEQVTFRLTRLVSPTLSASTCTAASLGDHGSPAVGLGVTSETREDTGLVPVHLAKLHAPGDAPLVRHRRAGSEAGTARFMDCESGGRAHKGHFPLVCEFMGKSLTGFTFGHVSNKLVHCFR